MPSNCIEQWKYISLNQIYEYEALTSTLSKMGFIRKLFPFEGVSEEKASIQVDMIYYILSFAAENNFSPLKTSIFLTIMFDIHKQCIESPFINLEKDFVHFKNMLIKHSIARPPYSIKIFSLGEVKKIIQYALHTYFRHYTMYKYAFTKKPRLRLNLENEVLYSSSESMSKTEGEDISETEETKPSVEEVVVVTESGSILAPSKVVENNAPPQDIEAVAPLEKSNLEISPATNPSVAIGSDVGSTDSQPVAKEPTKEPLQAKVSLPELTEAQQKILKDLQTVVVNSVTPRIEDLYRVFASKMAAEENESVNRQKGKSDDKDDDKDKDRKKYRKEKKLI